VNAEQRARAMSTRERVDSLKAHGWYRFDSHDAQRWGFDGWVYSLAAAVRAQLENDSNLEDPDPTQPPRRCALCVVGVPDPGRGIWPRCDQRTRHP
jgi:hypothetical protein